MEDISPHYMCLRDAAEYLGVNRTWLAGALAALDIPLQPLGTAKAVRRSDLEQVRRFKPQKQKVGA